MKRLAVIFVLLAFLAVVPTAGTATARELRLERQVGTLTAELATMRRQADDLGKTVKTLQRQVKTLQAQVRTLQQRERNIVGAVEANFAGDACQTALVSDVLQGSWLIVDQIVTGAGRPPIFGPQAQISDFGACADLRPPITRQLAVPPTTSLFQSLVNWLMPS